MSVILTVLAVLHPSVLGDRKILRPSRMMIIRFSSQTPARTLHELLHLRHEPPVTERSVDLNQQLSELAQMDRIMARPLRLRQEEVQNPLGETLLKVAAWSSESAQWKSQDFVLTGKLKVSPEVPFGPGRELRVKWVSPDRTTELPGKVQLGWERTTYQVPVPQPGGSIVAQMVDQRGEVIGEGTLPVTRPTDLWRAVQQPIELNTKNSAVHYFEWYELFGYQGGSDRRPQARRVAGENRRQEAKPQGGEEEVNGSVRMVTRDSDDLGHATVSFARRAGEPDTRVLLLKEKEVEAYLRWMERLFPGMRITGIHLGQIREREAGIRGASVTFKPDHLRIVYLNDLMIPDPNLKQTSSHGLFVAMSALPGLYDVMWEDEHRQVWSTEIYIPEKGYYFGDHGISDQVSATRLKIQEYVSGVPLSGKVILHDEREVEVHTHGGEVLLTPNSLRRTYLALPQEGPYLAATYVIDLPQTEVVLPRLRADWVMRLNNNNDSKKGGMVIIFPVDTVPAEVEVSIFGRPLGLEHVHFFDAAGNPVYGPVSGGGFVIAGIEPYAPVQFVFRTIYGVTYSQLLARVPEEWLVATIPLLQ